MNPATLTTALSAVLFVPAILGAQTTNSTPPPRPCVPTTTENVHAFVLKYAPQPSDMNEIYTALRNMLPPDDKSYLLSSRNTIFVCGTPEQIALAQKMLDEVDKPKKTYRLTYEVAEMEGTKRINSQRYSITAIAGQKTTLKEGSRIPIATGSYSGGSTNTPVQTQFTYIDVGMNFEIFVDDLPAGVRLSSSIEQSSVAEDKAIEAVREPVIRQNTLKGSAFLTPGKPLMLGSVDLPGSTHRLDIQVTMDPLP